jgi:hypothetical protein
MACRLQNLSSLPLTVDLRGGAALTLAPAQLSPPLRDEDLAGNVFIGDWQQRGWLARVPIKFEELLRHEGRWLEAPPEAPHEDSVKAPTENSSGAEHGEAPAPAPAAEEERSHAE